MHKQEPATNTDGKQGKMVSAITVVNVEQLKSLRQECYARGADGDPCSGCKVDLPVHAFPCIIANAEGEERQIVAFLCESCFVAATEEGKRLEGGRVKALQERKATALTLLKKGGRRKYRKRMAKGKGKSKP